MQFNVSSDNLEVVREIFSEVAKKYLELLNNQALFKSKLDMLEVVLDEVSEEDCDTLGWIMSTRILSNEYKVFIDVNLRDSQKKIAFVIAHELAHLLCVNAMDLIKIGGKSTDGSTAFTSIQRMMEDGSVYGDMMEEAVADYLAKLVVERMDFEDENGSYAKVFEAKDKQNRLEFIETFSTLFGTSATETAHIDEITQLDEYGNVEVQNLFWYSVVSNSLAYIIDEYEKLMGKGSYENLNKQTVRYLKGTCNASAFAKREFARFKKLTEK